MARAVEKGEIFNVRHESKEKPRKVQGALGFHGFTSGICNGKLTVDFTNLDTLHFRNYTSDISSISPATSEPVFYIP